MNRFFIFLLAMWAGAVGAQSKFTLSGYLRDAASGEELLYASVGVPGKAVAVTTNDYGYYALTLPAGKYDVAFSYVGYVTKLQTVDLQQDVRLDVELEENAATLQEVVVTADRADENVRSTEMSVASLDVKEAKLVPVLLGEADVLKTLQLLPGVSGNSEGNSGFFVRGGDVDQNLILLDEAPVYNASHLLGFFSVFNSDALKDVKLYKGGIPAEYGGRMSSVLDIRMKNGNSKTWEASGGLGLISSRLTIEGPLAKDERGSIILSGRRTYADVVARAVIADFDASLYFYDFNGKANYRLGDKDRLYLSGYFGRDNFGLGNIGFGWGNTTGTLRWNHVFSDKLFSNTSLIYSDFDYGFNADMGGMAFEMEAGIFNYHAKEDFTWYLNPNNTVQFGGAVNRYDFVPGTFTASDSSDFTPVSLASQQALETALYLSNEQKIGSKLGLNYGLRVSTFSNLGPYTQKSYNPDDTVKDSINYTSGEFYNTYFGFEPRFSAAYILTKNSSVKASYNRTYQYLHQLSNTTSGTPTDMWIPSTPNVKPEYGDQLAIGYFRNFANNKWEMSVEAFYKKLYNQVDYENGAETFFNPDIEAEIVSGQGRAYGAEFFLRKRTGKLTGWVGYTLLKSERQFDDIDNGEWFSARQDRTHDFEIVASYQLLPKLNVAATWVYNTGDAVTFPTGKYILDGQMQYLYSTRNGDRMPDYHRLDLGVTWTLKDTKRFYSDLNFSCYNAYNRKNAYSITFQESQNVPGTTEAVKLSLFGVVPSVTWNFRF